MTVRTAELQRSLEEQGIAVRLVGEVAAATVDDVVHDSRAVRDGALFACVPGEHHDGHDFALAATRAGATALLTEREVAGVEVPVLIVPSVRAALGPSASAVHGHPSQLLRLVGITGTNGKTTTTALLASILRAAGLETETLGTLTGARTTPEGSDLQRRLREWVDAGVEAVVMEVSSHALDLRRVDGTRFDVGVFLNLSPEHLDFHGDMAAYEAAKARLFHADLTERAVVVVDDEAGRRIADSADLPVERCSVDDVDELVLRADGSTFTWRGVPIELRLAGRFNVANAVAAATTAAILGVGPDAISAGLAAVDRVDGRVEAVDAGQPFAVLVDYAHTPDALERVLRTARELAGDDGLVTVVFGAGGDRDREKRPLMGAVAARLADRVVVTSDNPRGEDPAAIIDAIVSGVDDERRDRIDVEPDRRAAIELAIANAAERAQAADLVIIAGKGHETTQEIDGVRHPFDDRAVAREAIERRAGGGRW
ncbi:MAG: UDP-N-acetylmuramoyl-L-alanyl-D-glutamate--2,6-diaminopimelate ligase [Actinomycetota bacterium]